ncbi:MAG TPA: hypothetical protein VJC05_04540 [Candidatus Andersenbacteria bacterium]|nr:hypothetical protein [Candidatus Andersenbacteria bacterium]
MTDEKSDVQDPNLIGTSADVFVKYYNENIPQNFPLATLEALAEFRKRHPSLFKADEKWIIHKHRKKFMDWLISHREK